MMTLERLALAAAMSVAVGLITCGPAAAGVVAASGTPGYRAEAVELKRDGTGGVTLTLKIYNDRDKEDSLACALRASGGDCGDVSGIYLVDSLNKKRHLVMRDSDGKCICTDTLNKVGPKGEVTVWAKFAAPPTDIAAITVVVPLFLPLDGVPVVTP